MFKNILHQLISFDTSAVPGIVACHDYVYGFLSECGAKVTTMRNSDGVPLAVWAEFGPPSVLMAGHLDVVPCNANDWASDPFVMTEKTGRLYGRGSCDMKGFVACVMAAVQQAKQSGRILPWHLCFTFDEETNMQGIVSAGPLLKQHCPKWCWIGEPTLLRIINTHLGTVTGNVSIRGKAAHGSEPDLGLSAINLSIDIINFIRSIAEEKKRAGFGDSPFPVPYTTFNIGRIEGGKAANIVADMCSFMYQYRPHPGDAKDAIQKRIMNYIDSEITPKFKGYPETGVVEHGLIVTQELDAKDNGLAVQNLKDLTGETKTFTASYATEAGFVQSQGVPTAVCGPGSIEQAHQANEFVAVSELEKCFSILSEFMK